MSDGAVEQEQNALLDSCLDSLRAEARSHGARVRALARLVELGSAAGTRRFLELEVAGSLRVGQLTAARWLGEAERYVTALPVTLGMLETGQLLVAQAGVLLHLTAHCPQAIASAVETQVLPAGAQLCPSDLRRLVLRAVLRVESEHADAAAAEQRAANAAAERRTFTRPEPDGMGLAGAVLTAEQLRTWSVGLDTLERAERITDRRNGIDRTADQRRADLFAALPAMVLASRATTASSSSAGVPVGGSAGPGGPVPVPTSLDPLAAVVLNVHVPMATVLELSPEPDDPPF